MEPFVQSDVAPSLLHLEPWRAEYEEITAGFTSRQGGAGKTPYDSLNCALHVGDAPEIVRVNRRSLAESLGFTLEDWTCGEQTHGAEIAIVKETDRGRGRLDRASAFQATDGLLTSVPGVLLTSFYADCVPLYFYDPARRAVGLAHAGWKGTVAEIAAGMVTAMGTAYGSRPEDIVAAVGPAIGECCYEVDDYVLDHVRKLESGLDGLPGVAGSAALYTQSAADPSKSMLNLKEMNRRIMIKAGILPTHIECTSWCTSCNTGLFFSYRKENGITGRMTSWIGIKES